MRLTTPPVAVIERTEGSLPLACETSRCTLVFGGPMRKPDHEAVIRFGGEAPRRWAHSCMGISVSSGIYRVHL